MNANRLKDLLALLVIISLIVIAGLVMWTGVQADNQNRFFTNACYKAGYPDTRYVSGHYYCVKGTQIVRVEELP